MDDNNASSIQLIHYVSSAEPQVANAVSLPFSNDQSKHLTKEISERFMYVYLKSKLHYEYKQTRKNIEGNSKLDN